MMTSRLKSFLSFVLLLGWITTFIVSNTLYQHSVSNCDTTNQLLEQDPCHISLYHPEEKSSLKCKHKSHIIGDITLHKVGNFDLKKRQRLLAKIDERLIPKFYDIAIDSPKSYLEVSYIGIYQEYSSERAPPLEYLLS